jgi:adenylate cyclase
LTAGTLEDASRRVGVGAATLRRWVRRGMIPQYQGDWTPSAIGHARVVARMRERGHSLTEIKRATEEGRLAFGFLEELFPSDQERMTVEQAALETGLDAALVGRLVGGLGFSPEYSPTVSEDEVQLLRYVGAALETGFPLVALLQLVRVYGQAMATIADAEVRLFHLYVHEPLLRSGSTGLETAEHMRTISREVLPLAGPVLDQVHQRYLQHFIEQDVVGHMEAELDGTSIDLGRMRVTIAFADLTGYTRLTEEEGELTAIDAVERFVEAIETTLPDEARVIKTIGDEAMIVSSDPANLTDWAVGFQRLQGGRPRPRIAIHCGVALYRDGDYYGRDVNIASRVAARAAGGEVLVTRPVVEQAGSNLEFERIAEIKLKGFNEATEIFVARLREEE